MSGYCGAPLAAVTGAAGYVGGSLVAQLRAAGRRVLELRRDVPPGRPDRRVFELDAPPAPGLLDGVKLLVHCAHDFAPTRIEVQRRINRDGAARLFDAARAAGVERIVFISTISAFDGCRSNYGRVKLEIERETRERGGAVIRPGLVHGGAAGGMVGSLERLVRRFPVLPLVGSGRQAQYLAHSEDLGRLVLAAEQAAPAAIAAPLVAAAEQPLPFRRILSVLAEAAGRRVVLVPVPWRLIWLGLAGVEAAGLRLGFRSDSVLSLVHQDPAPDFAPTRALGVAFREFDAAAPA